MSDPKKSGAGYPGQLGLPASTSQFNSTVAVVEQMLALVRTATLVQVVKCTNSGGVTPVGFVDVLPLVNLMDGLGQGSEHITVYNLPYSRLQGGKSAIICDPVVGDIGIAVFADRDISTVKKTKKQASPGSRRRNDLADGVYLFGVLNAVPTQYVRFLQDEDGQPNGMELVDKFGNKIEMVSAGIKVNNVLFDRSQNISAVADLTSTGNASLGGGSQFLKRADGSNATKVKGT